MKKLIALATLGATITCAAINAQAADVGLGVAVQSNDSRIYVPIDFDGAWRLEPSFSYLDSKWSSGTNSGRNESYEFAVGAFSLLPLTESVRLYFGGRLAYIQGEATTSSFGYTSRNDVDGYRVSPTLGFEYLINKHISIGGEAEWFYADTDAGASNGLAGMEQETHGTDTRLVVRVRF